MKINLDDITCLKTKELYHSLLDSKTFYLSQYSDRENPLKLSYEEKTQGPITIVDQSSHVVIAIVVKFDNNGLICRTPFPTNSLAFSILLLHISTTPYQSVTQY